MTWTSFLTSRTWLLHILKYELNCCQKKKKKSIYKNQNITGLNILNDAIKLFQIFKKLKALISRFKVVQITQRWFILEGKNTFLVMISWHFQYEQWNLSRSWRYEIIFKHNDYWRCKIMSFCTKCFKLLLRAVLFF